MAEVYEIVQVLSSTKLRDSESRTHSYQSPSRLSWPGYYVVVWPAFSRDLEYDAAAVFHGPYRSQRSALIAMSILCTAPAPSSKPNATRYRRSSRFSRAPLPGHARAQAANAAAANRKGTRVIGACPERNA